MARILVVDHEQNVRSSMVLTLRRRGHDVEAVESAEEADAIARDEPLDLIITDVQLPGASGFELLESLRRVLPDAPVIVTSAFGTVEDAVHAMQAGAFHFLSKPFDTAEVDRVVEAALTRRELPASAGRGEGAAFSEIVGESRALRELLGLVEKVAQTDSTVLVTGETGTGKELIGRAIHAASRRRERVFCALNSAAFPENLLESELFGHRRGAFTGAATNKRGLFEHADRGTVFLDEVAEMPLSMQAKLLRFLQTGEIRSVGSEKTRKVDVRVVTATNKDLEREVEEGRFREDLYYRLAVIPIHVPPLRERAEDIPVLAMYFLRRFAARLDKPVEGFASDAMDRLCGYAWPGNVRELENCVERGTALCGGPWIRAEDLPRRVREVAAVPASSGLDSLAVVERQHILNTLEKVGWNRKRAAEVLRISTTTLWRRLKEFGIDGNGRARPQDGAGLASG